MPFREQVINYPRRSPIGLLNPSVNGLSKLTTSTGSALNGQGQLSPSKAKTSTVSSSARNPGVPAISPKPEDKEAPEYKKKQALAKGPVLNMNYDNTALYGMPESLFTSLKDIFEAISANSSRIGVVSPTKFLEVLRRENEMFRSLMHQDAHEFLGLLLNEVVTNVEVNAKKVEASKELNGSAETRGFEDVLASATPFITDGARTPSNTGWVHELFEGTLTSETKCLTCENVSQRDEAFLDLSVDLDQHSSVTSCLRKFSEEEMLCERNKFHCDRCGGLQEAEKRMKIKRLPKILALHLKRFKFMEDVQRLQKLFHRVVYPYHLRLFNTTDDAEDPDKLYELYAVVVHIGGGPYHGHYVSIIKTEDRGWLLFDDEMVEPVDKSYVRNFFGDRPGLACAYVLFYQETTLEAMKKDQATERSSEMSQATESPKDAMGLGLKTNGGFTTGGHPLRTPVPQFNEDADRWDNLEKITTEPPPSLTPFQSPPDNSVTPTASTPLVPELPSNRGDVMSKKERAKEEKERRAAEKDQEKAAKAKRKTLDFKRKENDRNQGSEGKNVDDNKNDASPEDPHKVVSEESSKGLAVTTNGISVGLSRFRQTSKSIKKTKFWSSKDSSKDEPAMEGVETHSSASLATDKSEKPKSRFSSLRRKKSSLAL